MLKISSFGIMNWCQNMKRHSKTTCRMTRNSADLAYQLDLHGHTTEEALPKLEKLVSDAILKDLDKVGIMHGVGTGVLKKFVREWLRSSRDIASFRDATAEEGGKGITVATLK